MLPEVELDALHFLDRAALEGLQMHSRYLRDLVDRDAHSFPLRHIHEVDIVDGDVNIKLLEDGDRVLLALGELDLEVMFHRLNNTFIRRLALSFVPEDLPLPYYLHANASKLQCQIGALLVVDLGEEVEYALPDFLGGHLKPQTYQTSTDCGFRMVYAMLFTHKALRSSIMNLVYWLNDNPAPDYIFPELLGVDVVETCAMSTFVDPRPWIDKFIKMFETVERGTNIVRSMTLLHVGIGDVSPLRNAIEPLGQPRRTDVPTPHSAFINEWSRELDPIGGYTFTESTNAELFVFERAWTAKKLEIFVWTIEEWFQGSQTSLHCAFLLQVLDM